MSATVAVVEANILQLLRDQDQNNRAVDSDDLRLHLNNGVQEVGAEAGLGPEWVSSAVTLAANDYDYTLTSTLEYQRILDFRLVSRGTMLTRCTPKQIQEMRYSQGAQVGDPEWYALHEESDQGVELWVHPAPAAVDALDMFRSRIPESLDDEADTISFSVPLLRALEKWVAATLFGTLAQSERDRLFLGADFGGTLIAQATRAIRLDRIRRGNFRRTAHIPPMVVPT